MSQLFEQQCFAIINDKIEELKEDGIVNMSNDNLWQITISQISRLSSAPKGTNCRYITREIFNDITENIKFVKG